MSINNHGETTQKTKQNKKIQIQTKQNKTKRRVNNEIHS